MHLWKIFQGKPWSTPRNTQKKQWNLLGQKGVYPYEYMDGWEWFSDTKLPPKGLFYSSLNDEHMTQKQCKHAKKVWKVFKCTMWGTTMIFISKRMSTCWRMFLRTSEASAWNSTGWIWQITTHRRACLGMWCWKRQGCSWNCWQMWTCICSSKKGTRGRILMVNKRYAKASNPYVKDFDPTKPNNCTQYLDANNLHERPWANHSPKANSRGRRWCLQKSKSLPKRNTQSADGCLR